MDKNKMMNDVIRKYGMESREAIEFCHICEKRQDIPYFIKKQYEKLMKGSAIK